MTDKHKNQIGQVSGIEETQDYHADYRLGVIIGIYAILIIPISLLAYALGNKNDWDTNSTILFFAGTLMIFTVVYVTMALGIAVKALRTLLTFILKAYVVQKQHHAYIQTLHHEYPQKPMAELREVYPERPMLPDGNGDRQVLIDYIKYLYETNDDGEYIHIYDDGTIKGKIPWSTRERKISDKSAMNWIEKISYKNGKPVIYYENNTWKLNIKTYPNVENVVRSFNKTYVPPVALIEDGEFEDAS